MARAARRSKKFWATILLLLGSVIHGIACFRMEIPDSYVLSVLGTGFISLIVGIAIVFLQEIGMEKRRDVDGNATEESSDFGMKAALTLVYMAAITFTLVAIKFIFFM